MTVPIHKPTDAHRQAILYLEAVALLHDLGKFTDSFLGKQGGHTKHQNYNYELRVDAQTLFSHLSQSNNVPARFRILLADAANSQKQGLMDVRPDITSLLQSHQLQGWDGADYNLGELVLLAAQWMVGEDWDTLLNRSMQPAKLVGRLHGAAHYEKPTFISGERIKRQGRLHNKICRATPFGNETVIWKQLDNLLQELPLRELDQIADTSRRYKWLGDMRWLLRQGIADTQLSINDVTLWDWGYTVAALTKSAAYTIFHTGAWPQDLTQLTFRTLSVSVDRLGLYARSDKISDLLGVRTTVDNALHDVRQLLEVEYAIGNRIYHDHTGTQFLLPNVPDLGELRAEIQQLFDEDFRPQVHLGDTLTIADLDPGAGTHSTEVLTRQQEAIRNLLTAPRQKNIAAAAHPVQSDNNLFIDGDMWTVHRDLNAELCTVCHTRPVGYPSDDFNEVLLHKNGYQLSDSWATTQKARERNVCRICLFRRGRRSQTWLENDPGTDDAPFERTIWADEVADDNGRLALLVGSLQLEDWLNGKLVPTLRDGDFNDEMVGKNASPARLFRIAETARGFWQTVTETITPQTIEQRPFRLALSPSHSREDLDLGHAHAYELDLGEMALGVVYDREGNRFVTAENLAYSIKRWPGERSQNPAPDDLRTLLVNYLTGRSVTVCEPSQYLRPGQELRETRIEQAIDLPPYDPFIPLLAEPGLGLVLVPALAALKLARAVREHYLEQMGRVVDRLPLHLGIVYFPRRTPMTAVLDAGRRLLQMPAQWEAWTVQARDDWQITFARDGRTFIHTYPAAMGDGRISDYYYPYLPIQDPAQVDLNDTAALKHVTNLTEGDIIYLRPGRFDFEFLDTVGRRFEINYGADGKRPLRSTRPFLLQDLDRFHDLWQDLCRLRISQRHQVIFAIEATREAWFWQDIAASRTDAVFADFVADTLMGANWPRTFCNDPSFAEKLDALIQAGITGELADLAELHMEVMKEKEAIIP